MDLLQASDKSSSTSCSAETAAPYGLCSLDLRFYSENVAHDSIVTIGLRCFAVNGGRDEELCQVQVPQKERPFAVTSQTKAYAEWKDVHVPCRSVVEVSFSFGSISDSHLLYVGQVSKLYVMAKAESELIRCLSDVPHDDWFRCCGPNLSASPVTAIQIFLPQQFSSERYNKIIMFDLKEEDWKVVDSLTFRKLNASQATAFHGTLRAGKYRLYLWDNTFGRWIMDGNILTVPEFVAPQCGVLFGHTQYTDKVGSADHSRVMDVKVGYPDLAFLPQFFIVPSQFFSARTAIELANNLLTSHI